MPGPRQNTSQQATRNQHQSKSRTSTSQPQSTQDEEIEIETAEDPSIFTSSTATTPTPGQGPYRSWVWTYFIVQDDQKLRCTVPLGDGKPCNKILTRDKTKSTKSMIEHLTRMHHIDDPKKRVQGQTIITNLFKRKHVENRVELTPETFKRLLANMLASADLPFAFVKNEAFVQLLEVLNPRVSHMIIKRKPVALEVSRLFLIYSHQIKKLVQSFKHVGFTLDAWTSPNKIAFLGITAHGMTSDWQIVDILVALPAVYGEHKGENFAVTLHEVLKKLEITGNIVSITADNASNNGTLAKKLSELLKGNFQASEHLLGCMAHVINLAAKDGLDAFGLENLSGEEEISLGGSANVMDINHLVDLPDGRDVNLKTIITRIHGLSVYVRGSPQRREAFQSVIHMLDDHLNNNTPQDKPTKRPSVPTSKSLILDVATRWNLTFLMVERAIELKEACNLFCGRPETKKFKLNNIEWDKAEQLMKFLKPLHEVTELLCGSTFPTLNFAIPIYISLIKTILQVECTYNAAQLIKPAKRMIEKLKKYLMLALEKPLTYCAMVLDPHIKLHYIDKNHGFLWDALRVDVSPSRVLDAFKSQAQIFDQERSKAKQDMGKQKIKPKHQSALLEDVFGKNQDNLDLNSEIHRYLGETNKASGMDILKYWQSRQQLYPSLATMASCFLAIPATSAPSERIFSSCKNIIGSQRYNLDPTSIEQLLCLKEWGRKSKYFQEPLNLDEDTKTT